MNTLMGLRIIISAAALKTTDERLFLASKNRSKRIHKKLVKRFGGEFRKVPAIFRTPDSLIMHPLMYHRFQIEVAARGNTGEALSNLLAINV